MNLRASEQHPSRAPQLLERLADEQAEAPRLLVVLAHADDEVLALGGRLHRLGSSHFLTLTDGAPADGADAIHHGFETLEAYREARRAELEAAFTCAGLPLDRLIQRAEVVADQTASLHLDTLTRAVAQEIGRLQPDAVLTHPFEGGHPDHDACCFSAHMAVQLCAMESALPSLPVLEAPFYHAGTHGQIVTGELLHDGTTPQVRCRLQPQEQVRKRELLACFRSQAETLAQFGVETEMFRVAPAYRFDRRPHTGRLFYEQSPWGMDGNRFCALAQAARNSLFESATV